MNVTFDGIIDLATGMSAKSKIWKNKKAKWSKLVAKLCKENKTNETFKQYISSTKEEKSKIKDVGGYVGGYLNKGKRSPKNVLHRQLLTLDIDYAHSDFWDDFTMLFNNAAVLHATHSHSPTSPRYRLIIPVSRELTVDEYSAVSRYVAGKLDIELFDNTTFEPNRLMFWPSNSSDVDYYCEFQDGPWIDADEVLDSYVDWKDSSSWPTSRKNLQDVRNMTGKQKDPLEKAGIVGVFCRSYTIDEVITTFLNDTYSEGTEGRYTYVHGSTSNGLIVYDDKFAYSHHGTDPCGGILCNAFDLVRIHKFGHLDEDTKIKNPVKIPSYKEMESFAMLNPEVKRTIANEKIGNAVYDFNEDYEEENELPDLPEVDLEWAEGLEVDTRGKYLSSAHNLNLIFDNDSRLKHRFKFNEFDNKRYVMNSMPWRKISEPEPIRNVDYAGVRNYIECTYGITGIMKIEDAISLEFQKQSFHPIKDYMLSLKWDRKQRVDTILIDYFGAEETLYSKEAIRKILVAAVARLFEPGKKFDLVLTLVGEQGCGKSTLIDKLGKGWSSDTFTTVTGKESFEQLQGAWLIEMAELSGLRKAEVESIKHFISKREDTFRPAYARAPETFKRQCVFFGTTNNINFLRDPTGNRRFMPVDVRVDHVKKSIFDIPDSEIDQIWAEAYFLYKKGEKLYLSNEANTTAKQEQKQHSAIDSRSGVISEFLERKLPKDWDLLGISERRDFYNDDLSAGGTEERDTVCVAEIWCECFAKNKSDMTRYNTRDINEIMRNLEGWEYIKSTKNFKHYGKQKYYARKLY